MSRLYLGKLNNVSHHELSRIVTQYGPIVDFLMKEKYAFVVSILKSYRFKFSINKKIAILQRTRCSNGFIRIRWYKSKAFLV